VGAVTERDELLAANRANWDDRTGVHLESRFYDVEGWLRDGRGPRSWDAEALGDVQGLRLLHLQCHFGQDTLAWARAGAEVTGLDFSPKAIDAARDLARRAGLEDRATFVCADVLDSAKALAPATYDVVYVSMGALCWLPSVERWASQVGALIAPGGRLYLHDGHPVAWAMDDDVEQRLSYGYFEEAEPFVWDSDQTYTDATRRIEHGRTYEWNHSIGEIVTALVDHGLTIDRLEEHDWTVCQLRPWLVESEPGRWRAKPGSPRLPLSFSLLAHRRA
jgi:SAM-dependent methyltransferase